MKLHANARTCPRSRRLLVARIEQGWSAAAAAAAAGVSERTARKWLARWRAEGGEGLLDRSSRPRRSPRSTGAERVAAIIALRRLRMTAAEIGEVLSMPLSTVSLVLKRVGLGKRSRLAPLEPANRYERRAARRARPRRRQEARHGSLGPAIVSSDAAAERRQSRRCEPAGSTSTSASTTTADSPTPKSSPTNAAPTAAAFLARAIDSFAAPASRSSA